MLIQWKINNNNINVIADTDTNANTYDNDHDDIYVNDKINNQW